MLEKYSVKYIADQTQKINTTRCVSLDVKSLVNIFNLAECRFKIAAAMNVSIKINKISLFLFLPA